MSHAGPATPASLALALAAAAWGLACAGAPAPLPPEPSTRSAGGGAGGFPTPEELEGLGPAPAGPELFDLDVRPVDAWTLVGPFPTRVGALPQRAEDPWSRLLEQEAGRRVGLALPTEAMHCLARELGRFYLAHGGQPAQGLRRFMAARCHASTARVAFRSVEARVGPALEEAQLFAHWRAAVLESIRESLAGGPRVVGIWFGRSQDRAVVMVASGHRELRVEPFSPRAAPDGTLTLEGESLVPTGRLEAFINHGHYGFERCAAEGELPLPRFRFRCRVDPEDAYAYVSVNVTPPDRLLSRSVIQALVWPGNDTVESYREPHYAEPWPVGEVAAAASDFVELLNAVRGRVGLTPLTLDPAQSAAAAELAPHFFGAVLEAAPGLDADLVVLGMLAGWNVEGIVQDGRFAAAWVLQSDDLARLLASALETPIGRQALLAPEVERIAVGPVVVRGEGAPPALAAVFATYTLFSESAHQEAAGRVRERLAEARGRRGLRPAGHLEEVAPLCRYAASAVQGGSAPADAMNELLQQSAALLARPVAGWISEVGDLEELSFPEEYLNDPALVVAVAVTHTRRPGEAWGRYVVMLVVAEPEARGA